MLLGGGGAASWKDKYSGKSASVGTVARPPLLLVSSLAQAKARVRPVFWHSNFSRYVLTEAEIPFRFSRQYWLHPI